MFYFVTSRNPTFADKKFSILSPYSFIAYTAAFVYLFVYYVLKFGSLSYVSCNFSYGLLNQALYFRLNIFLRALFSLNDNRNLILR